jgi:hypothetical protein
MTQESLYQFTGGDLVREFAYDRSGDRPSLVLTFVGQEGRARLLFVNPYPEDELFSILSADEVWIYEDDPDGQTGRIKVEYWVNGFCQFTADNLVDMEEASNYDTDPGDDRVSYQTGPIDTSAIKQEP